MTPVTVYRNATTVPGSSMPAFGPLPPFLDAALGSRTADYDSFKIGYLPEHAAKALAELARAEGLVARVGLSRRVHLAHRGFDSGASERRFPPSVPPGGSPAAVPNRWLVQFAFPIQSDWLSALEACGVPVLQRLPKRVVLVEASRLGDILTCGVTAYLEWADPFYDVDRIDPELLGNRGAEPRSYEFHLVPGTSEEDLVAELGPWGQVLSFRVTAGVTTATVLIAPDDLPAFVATAPLLVHVELSPLGVGLSGERQAQVIAGQYDGSGQVAPGYQAFLKGRGLWSATNTPAVAIFDTGVNQGAYPFSVAHPWLENPVGHIDLVHQVVEEQYHQAGSGHGTFVAGIVAANPSLTSSPPTEPGAGFKYAFGVSPFSKLWTAKWIDFSATCGTQVANINEVVELYQRGLNFVTSGADGATISNNSWHEVGGCGDNSYTGLTRSMDAFVRDASSEDKGEQPMTLVFAAGNFACGAPNNCGPSNGILRCGGFGGTSRPASLDAPATSRNSIAVGATENYYPQENSCGTTHNPQQIWAVTDFSGKGQYFEPFATAQSPMLHTTRVKPDVVAPGWRVHSTVPVETPWNPPKGHPGPDPYQCGHPGCEGILHSPAGQQMTYSVGTSFAAPAVSGAAALFTKEMRDVHQVTPRPALIKAALAATADELWDFSAAECWGGDCRPSYRGGWGRVNVDRLTDFATSHVFENETTALTQGQTVSVASNLVVDDPTKDVLIVLAWTDAVGPTSAMVNDLDLLVQAEYHSVTTSYVSFYGNNFSENIVGIDNGFSYAFFTGGPSSLIGGGTPSPVFDETNNVEAVFIDAASLAGWQVEFTDILVTAQDINSNPASQNFALFAYNLVPQNSPAPQIYSAE